MSTGTAENGLESMIMRHMTRTDGLPTASAAEPVTDTLDEVGNLDETESEET